MYDQFYKPYYVNQPYSTGNINPMYRQQSYTHYPNIPSYNHIPQYIPPYQPYNYYNSNSRLDMSMQNNPMTLQDYGPEPFTIDIEEATLMNNTFRTALWTGNHLQITLMSIGVGEDIGLENHPNLDQFLRIEQGEGVVMMGDRRDRLDYQEPVQDDYAIVIPAGKWHNLVNTGNQPLKLYSIYAPPQHPYGTVHETKADALAAEEEPDRFKFY